MQNERGEETPSYTDLAKQQTESIFVLNQYFSKAVIPAYLDKRYNSLSLVFSASITLDSKEVTGRSKESFLLQVINKQRQLLRDRRKEGAQQAAGHAE